MTAPLKIGLLTPACRGYNAIDGGIASHFADLALALADAGHDVRVITPAPCASQTADAGFARIRFIPFDATMPRWLHRVAGLRWQLHAVAGLRHRIVRAAGAMVAADHREPFDIVETTSTGVLAANFVRRSPHCPVATRVSTTAAQLVSHNQGLTRWPDRIEQRREAALVRASDGLITHTLYHRDEICRLWGLAPEKFAIVPHGIALPPDSALPPHVPRKTIEVLYVGRYEHRKGIDVLLDAIPLLLSADPRLRFTLIGQDSGDHWQKLFRSQHPEIPPDHVTFAGCVPNPVLQAAYRDCDIFVAPSRYESFGLIYVEAMAWAKPVVGCAVGGVPEVVAAGEVGWLAAPGNVDDLTAQILKLARDETMRAQFGVAARRRAARLFSRARLADNSAACYRDIIDRVRPASR